MSTVNRGIQQHYARGGLGEAILAALAAAGKNLDRLKPEDLAPVDEFHVGRAEATRDLAKKIGLTKDMHVLDMGSGIGGPARYLASEYGCRVTGIDLTEEYVNVARMLTQRLGLSDLVTFHHGSALDLPFAPALFDVIWTQHAAMNIPDKARLYAEAFRVLKPGGRLALYDILSGPAGPVHFPVPWARSPETSFLLTPDELRRHLHDAGFEVTHWRDYTEAGLAWFTAAAAKLGQGPLPALGIHLLLGAEYPAMARNQVRNLREGRIVVAQVTGEKPGPAPGTRIAAARP